MGRRKRKQPSPPPAEAPVMVNLNPGPPDWDHIMKLTMERVERESSEPYPLVMSYEHFLIETGQHPLFRK